MLLIKQMRQTDNTELEYYKILKKLHRGEITDSDYIKLMKQIIVKTDISSGYPKITQSNTTKYQLNLTGVLKIARRTKESVYLFIIKYKL